MTIKKVAIFTPGFVPVPAVKGGAIEQLIEYIIEQNERAFQYVFDVYTIDDLKLREVDYKHTRLIRIKDKQKEIVYRFFYGVKNRLNKYFKRQSISSYVNSKFVKEFKKNYYDKVIIENNMDLYRELYPKLKNEEIIFHLHNNIDCGDRGKTKEKTEFILDTADKVIVASKFLKRRLLEIRPTCGNKISVVYNGVISQNLKPISQNDIKQLKEKYDISKEDVVFTYIGRLNSEKGADKLIDAVQKLKQCKNIKLLIVGDSFFDISGRDKYLELLRKKSKGIERKIIFTNYVPNTCINKIYSISDCVIIPTQVEEVFGLVALESMTMGVPVIASKSGGLPEVLSNKCAVFINRDNRFVDNLSSAILTLYKKTEKRKSMGKYGRIKAKSFPRSEKEYANDIFYVLDKSC